MRSNNGLRAKALAETILYITRGIVSYAQGRISIHTKVNIDSSIITNAASAQFVRFRHTWLGKYAVHDEALLVFGKRLLEEFLYAGNEELHRYTDDKHTHYHGCYRIEHTPIGAQEDSAADTYRRADARECIAAMMPCIGYDSWRVYLTTNAGCPLIDQLFGKD